MAKRPPTTAGTASRRLAIDALIRIESSQAYANLLLPKMLDESGLSGEDRRLVTQMVYGTTRMQRACDHLIDRFLLNDVDEQVRAALRVGAYQLAFLATPTHAAVDATVGAVRGPGRGVVNAVLRRVAQAPVEFPTDAIRLSYPDWIVDLTVATFGSAGGVAALEAMNEPATTSTRDDGYVQDVASQLVVQAVEAEKGELVADLCAAPGGKATGLATAGARVIAGDRRKSRVNLIAENVSRLSADGEPTPSVYPLIADGRRSPLPPNAVDRVLVDAPCSGLGSLRRRADARWRIEPEAPARLAELQGELLDEAARIVRPGGLLVYSVCTFGPAEGTDVVAGLMARHPELSPVDAPEGPWTSAENIAVLPPGESDGMMLARFRKDH